MTTATKQPQPQIDVEPRRVESADARPRPVDTDELIRFMMSRYGNVIVRLADA